MRFLPSVPVLIGRRRRNGVFLHWRATVSRKSYIKRKILYMEFRKVGVSVEFHEFAPPIDPIRPLSRGEPNSWFSAIIPISIILLTFCLFLTIFGRACGAKWSL